MKMTLNDLTVSSAGLDREQFLSSWTWAFEKPALPVLITAMGDVFGQDPDGSVLFLDTCAGTVETVADSGEEFQTLLSNPRFVSTFLHPQSVADLRSNGVVLQPGQCYSHKQPLVLGGEDELSNIEASDVSVHVHLLGQIHKQVKDLPPGTPIDRIEIKQ